MKEERTVKESKQVNFRIDPDSAEAFRQFCTTHGMNQAQGFDHLMQVLELNNAKAATPGRLVEIENFERLCKELLSAYINSIELSSNAEARVLEQFQSDLKRKDRTIDELREKMEALQGEKEQAEAVSKKLEEEQNRLKEQAEYATNQLNSAKKAISDQEEVNRLLQTQNEELQKQLQKLHELQKAEALVKSENTELKLKTRELEQTLSHETAQRKNLESIAGQNQEKLRELESHMLEYKVQVSDLKRQLQEKDADTQNQLKQAQMEADLKLERAVIAKERELQEELRTSDRENVRLQTELEQLRASLAPNQNQANKE